MKKPFYLTTYFLCAVFHLLIIGGIALTEPHILLNHLDNLAKQPVLYIIVDLWYFSFIVMICFGIETALEKGDI